MPAATSIFEYLVLCRRPQPPRQDYGSRLHRSARAADRFDRVAADHFPASGTRHLRLEIVSAGRVNEQHRAAFLRPRPAIAPCGQSQYCRHQIAPGLRQAIFVAYRPALIDLSLDDAAADKGLKASRQQEARIFYPFSALKKLPFAPDELAGFILGLKSPQELEQKIRLELKTHSRSVAIHRASLSEKDFRIIVPHEFRA